MERLSFHRVSLCILIGAFDCGDATKVLIKSECKTCKNKYIFDFLNKLITKIGSLVGAKHVNTPENNGKTTKKIQIKQVSLSFFFILSFCLWSKHISKHECELSYTAKLVSLA